MNTLENRRSRSRAALQRMNLLVGCYVGLSVLTLAVIVLLRNTSAVNPEVWVRAIVVAASSLLTASFAVRTARASRAAYLRLRIASVVMLVAIAVIIALPGLPLWMKVEQGVCGVLLIGVVLIANSRQVRAVFAE